MKAFTMKRGQYVPAFPLRRSPDGGFSLPQRLSGLLDAYKALADLPDASAAKADALAADQNFTPAGRKAQQQDWFKSEVVPAMKKARAAVAQAEQEAETIMAKIRSAPASVDKSDAASAVLRSEMRTMLRGMSPERISALHRAGELPPEAIAAVLEAPSLLSGVSDELRMRMALKAHPEDAAALDELERGIAAVLNAERAVSNTANRDAAMLSRHVESLVGAPLSDRLKAMKEAGDLGPLAEEGEAA